MNRTSRFAIVLAPGALRTIACGGPKKVVEPQRTEPEPPAPEPPPPPPAPKSLFERLGNKEGIQKVVDSFVQNVDADKRVNKLFSKTKADTKNMERFKQMMVEQLCELSGGTCKYAGKDMKAAHKGMKITDAQFDAIVEDLSAALAENHVEEKEKSELFEPLAKLKEDIVAKPGAKK